MVLVRRLGDVPVISVNESSRVEGITVALAAAWLDSAAAKGWARVFDSRVV